MTDRTKLIEALEAVGLSSYESKAYSGLLVESPVTGYHLSKISGVPRSRIYETLERLEKKGYIHCEESEPNTYIPISGEEFVNRAVESVKGNMSNLRAELSSIQPPSKEQTGVYNIKGRDNILAKIESIITSTQNNITICGWHEDLSELTESFSEALNRSVAINCITTEAIALEGSIRFYKQTRDEALADTLRDITLISDKTTLLSGTTMPAEECSAIFTYNSGMVYVAREYLLHKVLVGRIFDNIPEELKRSFFAFYNASEGSEKENPEPEEKSEETDDDWTETTQE